MEQEVKNEALLRKYLLGELSEADEQAFEEELLTDDELSDLLLAEEDELVDDYLGGELSEGERERFDSYFMVTPERRKKLKFGEALSGYIPVPEPVLDPDPTPNSNLAPNPKPTPHPNPVVERRPWWKRAFSTPYLPWVAATVIVLAVGLVALRIIIPSRPKMSQGMLALREAYPDQRPTEARITEWSYAPPPPTTRGPERDKFDYVALDRAKALIQVEANEHPSAKSYHDLGRLYLAEGKFENAIDQFEKALQLDEKNAQLHSDYGAALLEQGKNQQEKRVGNSLNKFALALEHLNRALELDPSLLDALFNRALCRQYMNLPRLAEEDWRTYLKEDADSRWAEEARQNLKELQNQQNKSAQSNEQLFQEFLKAHSSGDKAHGRAVFSRCYNKTSNIIADRLIDRFLDLSAEGNTGDATKTLALLSYAGSLVSSELGDNGTAHLARFYSSTNSSQHAVLAQARSLMKQADEQSRESSYREAISLYAKSKTLFDNLGDHCEARYADYRIGHCRLRTGGTRASLDIFNRLATACKLDGHKWLLALVYNSIADAYNGLGEYSKALDYSGRALKTSEEIEDTSGIARCHLQVAIGYKKVDDNDRSLANLERTMQSADCVRDLSMQWIVYDVAAGILQSLHLYDAAIDYQTEASKLALDPMSPLNLSRSYAHLGLMYGKVRKYDEAIEVAGRAFEIGKTLSDQPIGQEMMAYTSLYLGDLHRLRGDYEQALNYYDQNTAIYAGLSFPLHRYAMHKGKFLCYVAQGNSPAAKAELETTLNLFEQYRSRILEESNRNSFFDMEQNIYDAAIDFEYSMANDSDAAFEKSEASRARSLLDLSEKNVRVVNKRFGPELLSSSDSEPLHRAEIVRGLPKEAQIIQYAMLDDKLLIWVLSGTELLPAERVKIGSVDLTDKVNRYLRKGLRASGEIEETKRNARELYDLLITPVARFLDKEKYLCIVPDKALNRLPFCALVAASGHYLVEDYFLGVSPSSTIFTKRSEVARSQKGSTTERAAVVGNPSFDREAFPSLLEMPSSTREAEGVAAFYNTTPLTRSDAREKLVKRAMENSDVIHLSTHYVADNSSYLLSAFPLAQEPKKQSNPTEPDGQLQVREIYSMKLSRPRLVVLAACRTGIEKTYEGEGAISAARPFIAAGVPVVVASLWPVESDSAAILMLNFHGHRKRDNRSTSEALCLAQREMIAGTDVRFRHPYYWASFAVIGGYATF